ncbi:MAG TPA: 16S rRNA (cytosine(1402)-N(4))-methyltransferase RsmH [Sulfurovum sp.]|jgi:16S rRNA (cytosine1402-N4)-methyltransferase|nr:MAG: 16S rRNA (cytosine(1402)-N(4))-methyltransferase [Sulfurovum sp. 35-42-20]OYZ24881.1 MAG: 16S rRNA (cytosine(1402)-N(4))-methyltransferase [Sulfurovum sp. 16-42-52]OYZ50335.1 MAG: 16S rRNA (cytosine(1402)-N(4))-methyltransferase [Sulfurovum sp. 24-42-9]OZA43496.1 MAG: 16S rRNA (cytosine(1402)-N(4))-methyltransferase [Sulfurovum sp. 17-42-90]OZA60658.1 MAG: 16S rRNA (cytosine(1402)-N(4))-methyltransferase [Sulfurovum sp. 39-42-12]HQR73791.1 16S rRNA (cytosine(1402)-N(4))-methyltransfera
MQTPHIPVLLDEVLDSFKDVGEGYFVDCTLGYAGHSSAILERYKDLYHIGIDRDDEALAFSKQRLVPYARRSTLYKGTFAEVFPTLKEAPIVAVLADFGVSSLQLDKKERGFSFHSDTLDMRMDASSDLSAYDVINGYTQERLEYIFDAYGEIPAYKKLAAAIVDARAHAPIDSAKALSEIAKTVLPFAGKIHPATLMFQAVRIEVNNELGQIEGLLDALENKHVKAEVVSLISFHSLEDRLVKNRFKKWSQACICDSAALRCTCGGKNALGKTLFSKPKTATALELKANPRSRSAKLRSFRFTHEC